MNFMETEDIVEMLNAASLEAFGSGDHIFVTRPDGKELTVWLTEDGALIEGEIEVNRVEPLTSFVGEIENAILNYEEPAGTSEEEPDETSGGNLTPDFFEEAQAIRTKIHVFASRLEPYKKRFHMFLAKEKPSGYLQFSELNAPASEYTADFDSVQEEGIVFSTDPGNWDSEEIFYMPFAYTQNPEQWEKDLLERIHSDRSLALKAFRHIPALNGYIVGEVSPDSNNNILLVAATKENEEKETVREVFVIVKAEQAVYSARDYFDAFAFANGLVQAVGFFQ